MLIPSHCAGLPVQSATSMGVITGRVNIYGRPAPNVHIVLEPFDSTASDNRLPRTVTDEYGNYRLTGIPEGRFQVMPIARQCVIVGEPGVRGLLVTLTRDDRMEVLDFAIAPGLVITGRVV